jgi:DNA-binding response OmpR family regulator
MKSILVAVRYETLRASITEVLSTLAVEMVSDPEPTLEKIEELMPVLVIVDYSENESGIDALFKSSINNELTAQIPFMFIIPEASKWNEIDGFRLGFDTKVSRERPKLGIQLRVQVILKKGRPGADVAAKVKDMQQLMQSIMKKAKGQMEESGAYPPLKIDAPRSKILIVEDEPLTRTVLQTALEKNYELVFAVDGQKGFETAINELPDLIISDFMMPVMDGLQLLEKVRSSSEVCDTPFLFLTAKSRVEDKIEGLEHGANEYLSKPFSVRELQLRVERLIEEGHLRRGASGALQGQLAEVGLPDVLHVIGNNQKTGELIIDSRAMRDPVRIYFQNGQIVNASFGKSVGLKALFRSLALVEGNFSFQSKPCIAQPVLNEKMENLLLEGYRQFDEIEMMRVRFPSGFITLLRPGSEKAVQTGLSTVDAVVLYAVGRQATVQEVLDKVSHTDFEILECIVNLLDAGLLTVVGPES